MIRTKLFMGLALLVIGIEILSALFALHIIKSRVVKEAQTRVRMDLVSAWSEHNAKLEEIETVLKLAAGKRSVLDASQAQAWPNQDVQNRLEMIRLVSGLDFITLTDPRGRVVMRTAPPYSYGDFRQASVAVRRALEGEITVSSTLMSRQQLEQEAAGLSDKAFMVLEDTPRARRVAKVVESRGMVMLGAVPVREGGEILGVLYGGILLNRNHGLVDKISRTVFEQKEHGSGGTVTVFIDDSRVATTVRLANGNRALGTRASKEVADRVLDNGLRWEGRAFVVNEWYLTAYDPIRDEEQKVIGMLYVGIPEKPFTQLISSTIYRYVLLSIISLVMALVIAFFLAGRIARPLHRLAEAAKRMHLGERPHPVEYSHASKETRILIESFNEMAKTLGDREAKLLETNKKIAEANGSLKVLNHNYMETVSFISHELKSPLATIMNYVYLLSQEKFGPLTDKQSLGLKNIDNNVKRIVEMVRHYLNLSRIEKGELEPVISRVAILEDVLEPLLEAFAVEAGDRNINLLNQVCEETFMQADLNMTREIFENLISNALKYGRQGGSVSIAARPQNGFMCFRVFNEGEGIPREKRDALFKKFSRLETDGIARRQKGTGLGLFITKQIINAHGGEISLESKPGEGVTFVFTLPCAADKDRENG
jgi:two-component system NtrC family sensor kinase